MTTPGVDDSDSAPNGVLNADVLIRRFVEHWGVMARTWGINTSMGELFALLYITGGDWTAEELRARLDVSRGNVSMNLRELIAWGVVRKVHRPGERRELFRAEGDVWTLFRRIMLERKRREIEPTRKVLDDLAKATDRGEGPQQIRRRVDTLRRLMNTLDELSERLMALSGEDLAELGLLLSPDADAE